MFSSGVIRSLVFIGFVAITEVRSNEVFSKEESEAFAHCRDQYGIHINVTDYFQANAVLPDEQNQDAKCLFICAPKILAITDDTGYIDSEKARGLILSRHPDFDEIAVKAVIKVCLKRRNETNLCDKWYEFTKCNMKAYLDHKKRKHLRENIRRKLQH